MKRGVFLFSYPVVDDGGSLYLGDACYEQTLELSKPLLADTAIVARRRSFDSSTVAWRSLDDIEARLALELPDFGVGGYVGWLNALYSLLAPRIRTSLRQLLRAADLIYVEAPSIEAYLAAIVARQIDQPLVMEMRGEVVLNEQYMRQRFGLRGSAYAWIFRRFFESVRKQACAGLYVNASMMHRYPVAGQYRRVISDVRLPDDVFDEPRCFTTPASRFLYVGHLERVKQVDLIIQALHLVQDELPSNWTFDIVGKGPEMTNLRQLSRKLGIHRHTYFHGRVSWGEPLFAFYREADLFLMASLSEGASRTLIEAMAHGLPVLSTSVGTATELLDQRALVPEDEASAYAERLLTIAVDPEVLSQFSLRNWKGAQEFRLSKLKVERQTFFAQAIELSTSKSTRSI